MKLLSNKRSQAVGILMSSIHLDLRDIQNGEGRHVEAFHPEKRPLHTCGCYHGPPSSHLLVLHQGLFLPGSPSPRLSRSSESAGRCGEATPLSRLSCSLIALQSSFISVSKQPPHHPIPPGLQSPHLHLSLSRAEPSRAGAASCRSLQDLASLS